MISTDFILSRIKLKKAFCYLGITEAFSFLHKKILYKPILFCIEQDRTVFIYVRKMGFEIMKPIEERKEREV
ncbi:hypothetical protein CVD28_01265 [Bacillus sp. M6-12]|nr:hypothetical protein CVD28_01265 [Bacillus sp. M6-12]